MGQEHKYRAWHRESKKMLTESYLGEVFLWLHEGQPIEIIEYTGLKDKQGKEIYEGDLIKYQGDTKIKISSGEEVKDPWWRIDEICWESPEYKAITHKQHNYIWCKLPRTDRINMFGIPTGEVIGNIYENPELLKIDSNKKQ